MTFAPRPSVAAVAAVLLAFVAAASASAASGSTPSGLFRDILVVDCEGAVRAAPSHGVFGTIAYSPLVRPAFNYLRQQIMDKASCHCPGAAAGDVERSFDASVANALWHAENPGAPLPDSIRGCGFRGTAYDLFPQNLDEYLRLPASCSSESWERDGTCMVQARTNRGGQTLKLALAKCESSELPFVSLSCEGPFCDSFLAPCQTDSNCAGDLGCDPVEGLTTSRLVNDIVKGFSASNVYPDDPEPCEDISSFGAATGSIEAMTEVIVGMLGGQGTAGESLRLCGASTVLGAPSLSQVLRDYFFACHDDQVTGGIACLPWNGFGPWDGLLADGTAAAGPSRKSGAAWRTTLPGGAGAGASVSGLGTANQREIVSLTCETRLSILRGTPLEVTVANPNPHRLLAALQREVAEPLMQCRGKGGSAALTPAQYEAFHNVLSPQYWLKIATSERDDDSTPKPHEATSRDALGDVWSGDVVNGLVDALNTITYAIDSVFGETYYDDWDEEQHQWPLPHVGGVDTDSIFKLGGARQTCSMERLTKYGACTLQWDGVGRALGKDVAVTLALALCPGGGSESLSAPSLTVGCTGADCGEVLDVWKAAAHVCEEDSDCPGSQPCERLANGPEPVIGSAMWGAGAAYTLQGEGDDIEATQYRLTITHDRNDDVEYDSPFMQALLEEVMELRRASGAMPPNGVPAILQVDAYNQCDDDDDDDDDDDGSSGPAVLTLEISFRKEFPEMANLFVNYLRQKPRPFTGLNIDYKNSGSCYGEPVKAGINIADDSNTEYIWGGDVTSCNRSSDFYLYYGPDASPTKGIFHECFGDKCANRDLFQGDVIAAVLNITGESFPAGVNRSRAGVCRPQWLDTALNADWRYLLKQQVESGDGTVTVNTIKSFCPTCRGSPATFSPPSSDSAFAGTGRTTGTEHRDNGHHNGKSGGSKLGSAAIVGIGAAVVVLGAAVATAAIKKRRSAAEPADDASYTAL